MTAKRILAAALITAAAIAAGGAVAASGSGPSTPVAAAPGSYYHT
jgi:hypothetical protein